MVSILLVHHPDPVWPVCESRPTHVLFRDNEGRTINTSIVSDAHVSPNLDGQKLLMDNESILHVMSTSAAFGKWELVMFAQSLTISALPWHSFAWTLAIDIDLSRSSSCHSTMTQENFLTLCRKMNLLLPLTSTKASRATCEGKFAPSHL